MAKSVRRYKAKKLERTLERRCVNLAKEQGWRAKKMNGMFDNHWPDRMFMQPRRRKCNFPIFFVEFKREGEELTVIQEQTAIDLKLRGFNAHKIDNFEAFKRLLNIATG